MNTRMPASFVGTTVATVLAVLYTYFSGEQFKLWTDVVRGFMLGGPVIALITYTITSFLWEKNFHISEKASLLGSYDYPLRVLSQIFLGLSLAAIGESIKFYIILFMIFVTLNTILSYSNRHIVGKLVSIDICNLIICGVYTVVSLLLVDLALNFENQYAAFVVDKASYQIRVTQLRGEQTDLWLFLALSVGAMVVNIGQIIPLFGGSQRTNSLGSP